MQAPVNSGKCQNQCALKRCLSKPTATAGPKTQSGEHKNPLIKKKLRVRSKTYPGILKEGVKPSFTITGFGRIALLPKKENYVQRSVLSKI